MANFQRDNHSIKKDLDRIIGASYDIDFFMPTSRQARFSRHFFKSSFITLAKKCHRLGFQLPDVTARTFWGGTLRGSLAAISPVFLWGFFDGEELNLIKFLVNTLGPEDVFFDGGAHVGFYSLLAGAITKEVHAFEPTPSTFKFLEKNVRDKKNISINQNALWKEDGVAEFNDCGDEFSVFNTLVAPEVEAVKQFTVKTTTIDNYCSSNEINPSFIKLDTEGAEYEFLLGAKNVLSNGPMLSIEIRPWEGEKFEKIRSFLKGFDYSLVSLEKGEIVPFRGIPLGENYTNVIFMRDKHATSGR